MPWSSGWMRIRLWALEASRVSWISWSCDIAVGVHRMTSLIRGSNMWLGKTVSAVTLEIELSTTRRGARPSAITTPSLPAAARLNLDLSSWSPPGTCATNPDWTSSWTSSWTREWWSRALFQADVQSCKGIGSDVWSLLIGHAVDGCKGWLTPSGTPTCNMSRKSASGSLIAMAKCFHNFKRKGWPGVTESTSHAWSSKPSKWIRSSMYGDSSDSFNGGSRDPCCKCAKIFKLSLESQSLWNQDLRSWSKIEPPVEPTCSAVLGRPPPSSTRDCKRGHWTCTGSMLRHWDNVKNLRWQEVNWPTNVANNAARSGGYSAVSRDRNVPSGSLWPAMLKWALGPWGQNLARMEISGRFGTKHQTFAQSTSNWQARACAAKGASEWTQLTIWSSSQVMLDPGFSKILSPPPRLIAGKMKRDLSWISDDSCTDSCWAMELDGTPSKDSGVLTGGGPGRLWVALECLQQNGATSCISSATTCHASLSKPFQSAHNTQHSWNRI